MSTFYKAVMRGTAGVQEIINVLYYTVTNTGNVVGSVGNRTTLAAALNAMWENNICPIMHESYVGNTVEVTVVDERNVTTSPFAVILTANFQGNLIGNTPTKAAVAIARANVALPLYGPANRPLRRSYLALGPITEQILGEEGAIAWPGGQPAGASAGLSQSFALAGETVGPARVGIVNPAGTPAFGNVASWTLQPYASFRRSRMLNPQGT